MNLPASEKSRLRAELRLRVQSLSAELRLSASEKLRSLISQQPVWHSAKSVLFYSPLPDEPDLLPLLVDALALGKSVFLPCYDAKSDQYLASRITDVAADLVPGKFGVMEPKPDCDENVVNPLDLILVPGLGFTLSGWRLGRGKGYYDRLLARVQGKVCGVAFAEQIVATLPHEPHDKPVAFVVTPQRWQSVG